IRRELDFHVDIGIEGFKTADDVLEDLAVFTAPVVPKGDRGRRRRNAAEKQRRQERDGEDAFGSFHSPATSSSFTASNQTFPFARPEKESAAITWMVSSWRGV